MSLYDAQSRDPAIPGVNGGIPWDPRLSEIRVKIFEQ